MAEVSDAPEVNDWSVVVVAHAVGHADYIDEIVGADETDYPY